MSYYPFIMQNYIENSTLTVLKKDVRGRVLWHYKGRVLSKGDNYIELEAFFDRQDMLFHGMPMHQGDRFIETYYTDRWYNIFEIHDGQDDHLRGWYVNIGFPAMIEEATLSYKDLALDVLIFPDGRQIVLDEDEFDALELSPQVRQNALDALIEVQKVFRGKIDQGNI